MVASAWSVLAGADWSEWLRTLLTVFLFALALVARIWVRQKVANRSLEESDGHLAGRAAAAQSPAGSDGAVRISQILAYPVKGCAAVHVRSAALSATGIAFDRRFCIVEPLAPEKTSNKDGAQIASHRVLGQSGVPLLACIVPSFELSADGKQMRGVTLRAPARTRKELFLPAGDSSSSVNGAVLSFSIAGDVTSGVDCGDRAAEWLAEVLARPNVRFARFSSSSKGRLIPALSDRVDGAYNQLSFADAAPLVVVSDQTLKHLNARLRANGVSLVLGPEHLRANLCLSGAPFAYYEDKLFKFRTGEDRSLFQGSGLHTVDPEGVATVPKEGTRHPQLDNILKTLRKARSASDIDRKGAITVGKRVVHMRSSAEGSVLRIGDELVGDSSAVTETKKDA